mmetsp:Transcript_21696/g.51101  ORF Transcript_21696/g.51101 Transcript_21696/m.51101 type:complete len:209 (-) Transcript_21696:940-1566(-)
MILQHQGGCQFHHLAPPASLCKQNRRLLYSNCSGDQGPCRGAPRSRICIALHHNFSHNKCHVHHCTRSFGPRYLVPPWQDGKPSSCTCICTHRQTRSSSFRHTLNIAWHFHSRNRASSSNRSWNPYMSSLDHQTFRDSIRARFSILGCFGRYRQSCQIDNSKSRRDTSSVDARLFASRKLCRRHSRQYLLNSDCNRKLPSFRCCCHPP